MRTTFTTLQTEAHDHTQTVSTDTAINTLLKREINNAQRLVHAELEEYITQKTSTASTVADQQFYHFPPDLKSIEGVKVTIGSVDYDLEPIHSLNVWNELNALDFTASAIFRYFYPRVSDFGLWPEPQGVYTMTLTYSWMPRDMSIADYTTGTVTVTNGSATVTGSGTTFTAAMVGRWFKADDDGYWYKISGFTNATTITLENTFQGTTAAGASYTLGETPEIPEEAHPLLAYRAAARFFSSKKKDKETAQYWDNMFFTGDGYNTSRNLDDVHDGLLGLKKRYSKRANPSIVTRKKLQDSDSFFDKNWATTLSS